MFKFEWFIRTACLVYWQCGFGGLSPKDPLVWKQVKHPACWGPKRATGCPCLSFASSMSAQLNLVQNAKWTQLPTTRNLAKFHLMSLPSLKKWNTSKCSPADNSGIFQEFIVSVEKSFSLSWATTSLLVGPWGNCTKGPGYTQVELCWAMLLCFKKQLRCTLQMLVKWMQKASNYCFLQLQPSLVSVATERKQRYVLVKGIYTEPVRQ